MDLFPCFTYSSTLKMAEVACCFKVLVLFYEASLHFIPEDSNPHSHCHENLKSHTSSYHTSTFTNIYYSILKHKQVGWWQVNLSGWQLLYQLVCQGLLSLLLNSTCRCPKMSSHTDEVCGIGLSTLKHTALGGKNNWNKQMVTKVIQVTQMSTNNNRCGCTKLLALVCISSLNGRTFTDHKLIFLSLWQTSLTCCLHSNYSTIAKPKESYKIQ
jgi:hypothetical protein